MPPEPRSKSIIRRQEKLGLRLLDRATTLHEGQEVGIDIQLDVFDRVSRWIAVRNRIEDLGETRIDDFKRRIHGPPEAPAVKGRTRRVADYQGQLDGIKGKLSGRGDRGNDRDNGSSGGEVPSADG